MPFRALVINPWVTDFKLYDEWMHPIGLYFLIAMLRQNGAAVRYINCLGRQQGCAAKPHGTGAFESRPFPKPPLYRELKRVYKLYGIAEETLLQRLLSLPAPDAVFVGSSMTYWLPGLQETVRVLGRVFPGTPVVAGGTSAMLMPLAVKAALPGAHVFAGSMFDQAAIRNSAIPHFASLRALAPEGSLLPALELLTHAFHGPALASLGCPLRCSYCASGFLHPGYARRPIDVVVKELASLQDRFGVTNFAWYDDALLYNQGEHFLSLAAALASAGVRATFHAPNGLHVRWLTRRVLDTMRNSGFATVRFGYETGHAEFSSDTGAKVTRKELAQKTALAREAGFAGTSIGVYVMAGLAGQTPQQVAEELQFVASLSVKAKPVFVSPVPATPLFERYVRTFPQLERTPLFHNDSFFITQLPGWDSNAVQSIMDLAKACNAGIA